MARFINSHNKLTLPVNAGPCCQRKVDRTVRFDHFVRLNVYLSWTVLFFTGIAVSGLMLRLKAKELSTDLFLLCFTISRIRNVYDELKMHVQITNFLLPRNRKKTKIRRHPKLVTNQQRGSVSVLGLSMEVAVDFQWIPPEAIFPLPRFAPRPLSRPSLLSPYKSPLEPG